MHPAEVLCRRLTRNVVPLRAHGKEPANGHFSAEQIRFIVGTVLVAIAVLVFLFARGSCSTAGAIAMGVLGLVSIAISRRR